MKMGGKLRRQRGDENIISNFLDLCNCILTNSSKDIPPLQAKIPHTSLQAKIPTPLFKQKFPHLSSSKDIPPLRGNISPSSSSLQGKIHPPLLLKEIVGTFHLYKILSSAAFSALLLLC
jgi:hypothetical protein